MEKINIRLTNFGEKCKKCNKKTILLDSEIIEEKPTLEFLINRKCHSCLVNQKDKCYCEKIRGFKIKKNYYGCIECDLSCDLCGIMVDFKKRHEKVDNHIDKYYYKNELCENCYGIIKEKKYNELIKYHDPSTKDKKYVFSKLIFDWVLLKTYRTCSSCFRIDETDLDNKYDYKCRNCSSIDKNSEFYYDIFDLKWKKYKFKKQCTSCLKNVWINNTPPNKFICSECYPIDPKMGIKMLYDNEEEKWKIAYINVKENGKHQWKKFNYKGDKKPHLLDSICSCRTCYYNFNEIKKIYNFDTYFAFGKKIYTHGVQADGNCFEKYKSKLKIPKIDLPKRIPDEIFEAKDLFVKKKWKIRRYYLIKSGLNPYSKKPFQNIEERNSYLEKFKENFYYVKNDTKYYFDIEEVLHLDKDEYIRDYNQKCFLIRKRDEEKLQNLKKLLKETSQEFVKFNGFYYDKNAK